MSYERRIELEALPAEPGYGKWVGIIGYGTELVERKQLVPVTIYISTTNGPQAVEAYRYENYRFAEGGRPVDKRSFSYTVWHDDREYTDYSPRAKQLYALCAETREELCEKARGLLDAELQDLYKAVAIKESAREKFGPPPRLVPL